MTWRVVVDVMAMGWWRSRAMEADKNSWRGNLGLNNKSHKKLILARGKKETFTLLLVKEEIFTILRFLAKFLARLNIRNIIEKIYNYNLKLINSTNSSTF